MTVILAELSKKKVVHWDSWFKVAAMVYLGCPYSESPGPEHPAFGGSAVAAMQYGNLAVQAPWLDLSNELKVKGCFEMFGLRGRLGVLARSAHQDPLEFHGIEQNFAVIETECTEDVALFNSRFKKSLEPAGSRFEPEEDDCRVTSDVILISVDEDFYRLLLRVKSPNHWRVIDPSDAMSGVIRAFPFRNCPHGLGGPECLPDTAKLYTFEEVLGRWPDTSQVMPTGRSKNLTGNASGRDPVFHITNSLNTPLKQNVTLALSVCTTATQNQPYSSCLSCTLQEARSVSRKPLRAGEVSNQSDRYIINLNAELINKRGSGSLSMLEQTGHAHSSS